MILIKAFRKFHRHLHIVIYPILFDIISLTIGWIFAGFYQENLVSIRLILEMGLPSVSHISNIPLFANNMDFLNTTSEIPTYTVMIVITLIVIGAFLQGGYISHLQAIATEQQYNFSKFIHAGNRNWIQFVILEIIIFFGKIAVAALLASFFGIIGVFASLVFFFVLRILFIYLEFSIVVDWTGITQAIRLSWGYLTKSKMPTLPLIIVLYAAASLISFVLHYMWSPLVVVSIVFFYAYVMSGIQLAFMMTLCKAREGHSTTV